MGLCMFLNFKWKQDLEPIIVLGVLSSRMLLGIQVTICCCYKTKGQI